LRFFIFSLSVMALFFSAGHAVTPLSFTEEFLYGPRGTEGLDGAYHGLVSSTGNSLYVVSNREHSVSVFDRDTSSGNLTFRSVIIDGASTDGLNAARKLVLSPDGSHLYAAGATDDSIVLMNRSSSDGDLTYVERVVDNTNGVDGLDNVYNMAMTYSGNWLYACGYNEDELSHFNRDASTGNLSYVAVYTDGVESTILNGPSGIAVHPSDNNLYVGSAIDNGIAVFTIHSGNGTLTLLEEQINNTGGVPSGALDNVSDITISSDGAYLYATSYDQAQIVLFSIHSGNGSLTYQTRYTSATYDFLTNVFSISISNDGESLYTSAIGSEAVGVFSRNTTTGFLTFVESFTQGNEIEYLQDPQYVIISPVDQFVHVPMSFVQGGVSNFSRNASTGALTLSSQTRDGWENPYSIAISANSDFLYAVTYTDDSLEVFQRSTESGVLTPTQILLDAYDTDGLDRAAFSTFSPDDTHLYVAGHIEDEIAIFEKASNGNLTALGVKQANEGGTYGLDGVINCLVSSCGNNLYAFCLNSDSIVVFSRDSATGTLSFVENHVDDTPDNGLNGSYAGVLSPNGDFLYAVANVDDAVTIYARNPADGTLTYSGNAFEGVGGVSGVNGAQHIVMSSDGNYVYVAGEVSSGVAVFSRNSSTGNLTFLEAEIDNISGVNGCAGARRLAFSPNDEYLLVVGYDEDAIAIFSRDNSTGLLTYEDALFNTLGGISYMDAPNDILFTGDSSPPYFSSSSAVNEIGGGSSISQSDNLLLNWTASDNTTGTDVYVVSYTSHALQRFGFDYAYSVNYLNVHLVDSTNTITQTISANITNTGSLSWEIPDSLSVGNYNVLITAVDSNSNGGNVLVGPFSITDGLSPEITSFTALDAGDSDQSIDERDSLEMIWAIHDNVGVSTLSANLTDPGGNTFDLSTWSGNSNGSLFSSSSNTGSAQWVVPNGLTPGSYRVEIFVQDAQGLSDNLLSSTFTIVDVNDTPSLASVSDQVLAEGGLLSFSLVGTDPDDSAPFTTLTYSLSSGDNWISVDSGTGVVSGTPDNQDVGSNVMTLRVTDGGGLYAERSANVTVINTSNSITDPGSQALTEDVAFSIDLSSSDEGEGVTYTIDSTSIGKGVGINASTGNLNWTPDNSHVGSHSVLVTASDGQGSDPILALTLTVSNVAPILTDPGNQSVAQGNLFSLDIGGTDEGEGLSYSLDSTSVNLGLNIATSSGNIDWTPNNDDVGTHTVTVSGNDGNGSEDTISFSLSVNNIATSLVDPGDQTVAEGNVFSLDIGSADEGFGLTYSLDSTSLALGMTVDTSTGNLNWTPNNGDVGGHTVTVSGNDGNGSVDSTNFTLTVSNVAPVLTDPGNQNIAQGNLFSLDISSTDEGFGLTYSLDSTSVGLGMSITGSTGNIDWTPNNDDVGSHTVTVSGNDGNGSTDYVSFSISVSNIATSLIDPGDQTVAEGNVFGLDIGSTDEGFGLTYSLDSTSLTLGMTVDSSTGNLNWTPENGDVGGYTVTVSGNDGNGSTDSTSFTLTVTNTAPVLNDPGAQSVAQGNVFSLDMSTPDEDEGLTYTLDSTSLASGVTISSTTGLIIWTPENSDVGDHDLTVTGDDGNGGMGSVTFTLTVTNIVVTLTDPGFQSTDEDNLFGLDINSSDEGVGAVYSLDSTSLALGANIQASNGYITWTPDNSHVGGHTFDVSVNDGNGSSANVSFGVNVLNVLSSVDAVPDQQVVIGSLMSLDVSSSDEGYGLTYTLDSNSLTLGVSIDGSAGNLSWSPSSNQEGSYTITVILNEGNANQNLSFDVDVNSSSSLVFDPVSQQTITVGESFSLDLETSREASGVTYTLDSASLTKGVSINASTGVISWIPAAIHEGLNLLTVNAIDGLGSSTFTLISVYVSSADHLATTFDTLSVTAGNNLSYDIDFTDETNIVSYSLDNSSTAKGMAVGSSTGVLTWLTDDADIGSHTVTVTGDFGGGVLPTHTFTIEVLAPSYFSLSGPTLIGISGNGELELSFTFTTSMNSLASSQIIATGSDTGSTISFGSDSWQGNVLTVSNTEPITSFFTDETATLSLSGFMTSDNQSLDADTSTTLSFDTIQPQLTGASLSSGEILLQFSEALGNSANTSNFSIAGPTSLVIDSISTISTTSLGLSLSGNSQVLPESPYLLSVNGLMDLAENDILLPAQASFFLSAEVAQLLDSDGDGIRDHLDAFPFDDSDSVDSDGDGIGDSSDTDNDGDGLVDTEENFPDDTDNDGIPNSEEEDRDGDGVVDTDDDAPFNKLIWSDMDGDGINDEIDADMDGDNLSNASDAFPRDSDNDGIPNRIDTDDDGDGTPDEQDLYPNDTDNDGTPNALDSDDDGDGLSDTVESSFGTNPIVRDTNGDGVMDSSVEASLDTDGDGLNDAVDGSPKVHANVSDLDADGTPDINDSDRDGDGILNTVDIYPEDSDNDGLSNLIDTDDDGDGIDDDVDTGLIDSDNDGSGDESDSDDDGDGYPDEVELIMGTDSRDANDFPTSAIPSSSKITVTNGGVVSYDFSQVAGYGDLSSMTMIIDADVMEDQGSGNAYVPQMKIDATHPQLGESLPSNYFPIGGIITIDGEIAQDKTLTLSLPLPDSAAQLSNVLTFKVEYFNLDVWVEVSIKNTLASSVQVDTTHFSDWRVLASSLQVTTTEDTSSDTSTSTTTSSRALFSSGGGGGCLLK